MQHPRAADTPTSAYFETIDLAQRFSRAAMDALGAELHNRRVPLNPSQAMILYRLGDDEVSAGALQRQHYLGTNVSYTVSKLVEGGFIDHRGAADDRRAVRLRATDKGRRVAAIVRALFEREADTLERLGDLPCADIAAVNATLRRLSASLTELIVFKQI